jgi:DNA-binding transcriptional LysR family regulator
VRVFRDRYPQVKLTMNEACTREQVEALNTHRIDIGFLHPPIETKGLMLHPVSEEVIVAVVPITHPLAMQSSISLSELAQDAFILHPRHEGPVLHDRLIQLCEQAGFRPNIVQEAMPYQTRIGLVSAGIGITFVPASVVSSEAGVVFLEIEGLPLQLQLSAAWQREPSSTIVQQFLKVMEELTVTG